MLHLTGTESVHPSNPASSWTLTAEVRYEKTSEGVASATYARVSGRATWQASGYLCNGTEAADVRTDDPAANSIIVNYSGDLTYYWSAIFDRNFTSSVVCGYATAFPHAQTAYSGLAPCP